MAVKVWKGKQAEIEMVEDALAGSTEAWERLVQSYKARMYKQARSFTTLESTRGMVAEDLVQGFWLDMFKTRLKRYRAEAPLWFWLRMEMHSYCLQLLRHRKQTWEEMPPQDEPPHLESPDRVLEALQLELTDRQRSSLRRRYPERYPRGIDPRNTSGYRGVHFKTRRGRWEAHVTYKKKRLELGFFSDKMDAVACRAAWDNLTENEKDEHIERKTG